MKPFKAFKVTSKNSVSNFDRPLTYSDISPKVPSIYSGPSPKVSSRYEYIPTSQIIQALSKVGYHPVSAVQTKCRTVEKGQFTRHAVRFRHKDSFDSYLPEYNEIIVINGMDGHNKLKMLAGEFVSACFNALVYGHIISNVDFPHIKVDMNEIIGGALKIAEQFKIANEYKEAMKSITMKYTDTSEFIERAAKVRFMNTPINTYDSIDTLKRARRFMDDNRTLWSTFNRVQEHLIVGGYQLPMNDGTMRTIKPITNIAESIRINSELHDLAIEYV